MGSEGPSDLVRPGMRTSLGPARPNGQRALPPLDLHDIPSPSSDATKKRIGNRRRIKEALIALSREIRKKDEGVSVASEQLPMRLTSRLTSMEGREREWESRGGPTRGPIAQFDYTDTRKPHT